jgi:serine/threonine protein phosphatase PrpC
MNDTGQKTAKAGTASNDRRTGLIAGAICDRGLNPKRPVNQDRYLVLPGTGLFAVFDGVGGRKAGEVASQTAADTVEETFAADSESSSLERIRRAILFANRDIYELGQTEPSYGNMATTVALLHIEGDQAAIAHVGDSRVYKLSDGIFSRETIDHTDFDDKVRAGLIPQDDARLRDDDHSINRALGVETDVDFELKTFEFRRGDRFLLCTDGVYRHLDDDELATILLQANDPQAATDEIRRLVIERGADDNMTAVIVQTGYRCSQPVTKDRIHVPLTRNSLRTRYDHGDYDDEPDSQEEEVLQNDRANRHSNTLIYVLLTLVLVMAAFYAGLRSANLFNKKLSRGQAAEPALDGARQAFDRGDFREAEQALSGLVASDSKNAQAWYWLGRTQLQERRFAESARSLEHAAELEPDMTDAYVEAAAAFEAVGNRTKALEMLGRYGEAARKRGESPR